MNLTKTQLLARNHLHGDVLVAAGAGSGKTKVLTERVIKLLLEDQVPLESLLLLTFTNAAAAEMKSRIRQALLSQQKFELAQNVDQAFIMTFDAFALYLVQKYAHHLKVDPQVGVYEQTLYTIERKLLIEQLFTEGYQKQEPAFLQLIRRYVINSDQTLKDYLFKLHEKMDLIDDKPRYLKDYMNVHFHRDWLTAKVHKLWQYYRGQVQLLIEESTYFNSPEQTEYFHQTLQPALQETSLDGLLNRIQTITFERLKPKSLDEEDKALRERLKQSIKRLQLDAEMVPIAQQMEQYQATQSDVGVILDLLTTLDHRLLVKKQLYQRYPFTDLAKMATQLLDDPHLRGKMQKQFLFIMVDEYQDTNDLQEAFLQKIATRNLMMVGDIKQSIYRFRNANSDLFQQKLKRYQPYENQTDKHQTVIFLKENFRSRPEVLSHINHFFSEVMSETMGGVHYREGHDLEPGQKIYTQFPLDSHTPALKMLAYEKSSQDSLSDEAYLIGEDILRKIQQQTQVVDLVTQQLRPIQYRDITILIDRKSNFESYIEVFNTIGIPLEVYAERNLSDSDLFRVLKNLILLTLHYQNHQVEQGYEHALISVLRSFLYQVSDEKLVALTEKQLSLSEFPLDRLLNEFSSKARHSTLKTWMNELFQTIDLEQKLLSLPNVPANLARLQGWLKTVDQLNTLGYTVTDFSQFLANSDAIEVELTITANQQSENTVKLMTIHKAKGLEFSHVYYPGLSKGFNFEETKGFYHYTPEYGIQLPYPGHPFPAALFAPLIVHEEKKAFLSEQVRLWYVALTRAKEQMTLVLETSRPRPIYTLDRARNFQDFISYYQHRNTLHAFSTEAAGVNRTIQASFHSSNLEKSIPLIFKSLPQSFAMKTTKRASMVDSDVEQESLLIYGSYLHECMFLLDFKTMDTSFIANIEDRAIFDRLTQVPLFTTLKTLAQNPQVIIQKEYAFWDEQTQQKGIIDVLIIEGHEATIIDYKTTNIDQPEYIQQLQTYAQYLTRQNLKIKGGYLISLKMSQIKDVTNDLNKELV